VFGGYGGNIRYYVLSLMAALFTRAADLLSKGWVENEKTNNA